MKKIKDLFKNKKVVIASIISIIVVLCLIGGGYLVYENERKQAIIDGMSITFNEDVKDIEYGTKDYDVRKELIKDVKDAELKEIPKVDTSLVGEQTLKFVLMNEGLEKEVEYKVNVKDTKAPTIKVKETEIELTVGDEFTISENIESVKDPVDGDIKLNDKASDINRKATEEYNKLNKESIKEDTKVAEKALNEFLIEDIKDKKEKNLYLKNCYYIDGKVDTSKEGDYTVKIVAVDKNGLKSTREFKVTVKEKEVVVETPVASYNGGSSPAPSVAKGSVWDVIATAQAQIGKPYVKDTYGPDTFDCEGLVQYAYTQNGYNIGRARYAGYSIGTNLANAQPGDLILTNNHVALVTGYPETYMADDFFAVTIVEASNPSAGIHGGRAGASVDGLDMYGNPYIQDIRRIIP